VSVAKRASKHGDGIRIGRGYEGVKRASEIQVMPTYQASEREEGVKRCGRY
jgi:hypothetical protein